MIEAGTPGSGSKLIGIGTSCGSGAWSGPTSPGDPQVVACYRWLTHVDTGLSEVVPGAPVPLSSVGLVDVKVQDEGVVDVLVRG